MIKCSVTSTCKNMLCPNETFKILKRFSLYHYFKNQLKSILRILARNAFKLSGTKHCPGKLFHTGTTLYIKCVPNTIFFRNEQTRLK